MPQTPETKNAALAPADRLIFALDVPDAARARALIETLGDSVTFYKLGLELFLSGAYFELVDELKAAGKKVFADLKLFDVPATVGRAVAQLARQDVDFLTVHGQDAMLAEAAANKGRSRVLAVTALTSLDQGDLDDLGFACNVSDLVLSRARRALKLGCDGVISSGLEVPALRAEVDPALVVVCPGIRPVANVDDQKRTMSVEQAFAAGADHIVVGRPIRDAERPAAAAAAIRKEIESIFIN
ncbi:MAG: orotidine-5'-phosphate decarboxylase [Wenzhouxiangellaceae bacterium]|nr:orotidine-5'-phosphate decarboxylase [Wenzhouxiangellaceae bacterium]MBS3746487.1 orotidine-5'-phosphate decarboxylase [Wenzhouxiangellaceae bacterium]MBS3823013.1 orotidine-5'-phosphate decarboxylase [Wenzhouxiangellaceae bacterium]